MIRDKLYKIGKYSIFVVVFIILIIGIFTTDSSGRSRFLEDPVTIRIITMSVLLLGVHLLYFNQRWVQDNISWMTKFLKNMPKVIQVWLSIWKSYSWNRLFVVVAGIFAIIWAILFFIWA